LLQKGKKQNTIKGLVDENGVRHEDRDAMCGVVFNYFSKLFESEVIDPDDGVLADVQRLVTGDMNRGLTAPFTAEEVKKGFVEYRGFEGSWPGWITCSFFINGYGIC
jgi:hypothetical protein